ncbi:MAG TPA: hypothetical protein VHY55_00185 [Acidimicrobiia bacterium]|nr:hypothetical protein [Acidimicrobiia bacterium]
MQLLAYVGGQLCAVGVEGVAFGLAFAEHIKVFGMGHGAAQHAVAAQSGRSRCATRASTSAGVCSGSGRPWVWVSPGWSQMA